MPRKSNMETREKLRREFFEELRNGTHNLDLRQTLKVMRRIAGKTQAEYARLCKVDPRSLIDFERGVGNPTLATLEAFLKPFNLRLQVGLKVAD